MARWSAQDVARVASRLQDQIRQPLRSKYGNQSTVVDNFRFDSRQEATRYCELKLLQNAKQISKLDLHRRFPLHVNGVKIGEYEADFVYLNGAGKQIVEDTKGFSTPLYRWKKKHMKAEHNIDIIEIHR